MCIAVSHTKAVQSALHKNNNRKSADKQKHPHIHMHETHIHTHTSKQTVQIQRFI